MSNKIFFHIVHAMLYPFHYFFFAGKQTKRSSEKITVATRALFHRMLKVALQNARKITVLTMVKLV